MPDPISSPVVYIVEDDQEVLDALVAIVASAEYTVRSFGSGQELLDAFDPETPSCVVSDVRLPRMSGLELQRELARRYGEVSVILITGFADVPTAVRSIRGGAIDYIEKPVRSDRLLERIRQALACDEQSRAAEAERRSIHARLELLSGRERQVVDLVVQGQTSKEIAARLGLSPRTIHAHRAEARAKLQAQTTADLIRLVLTAEGRHAPAGQNHKRETGEAARRKPDVTQTGRP